MLPAGTGDRQGERTSNGPKRVWGGVMEPKNIFCAPEGVHENLKQKSESFLARRTNHRGPTEPART